jgi:hypothetical protein
MQRADVARDAREAEDASTNRAAPSSRPIAADPNQDQISWMVMAPGMFGDLHETSELYAALSTLGDYRIHGFCHGHLIARSLTVAGGRNYDGRHLFGTLG